MRPVAGIRRQHEADDISQLADAIDELRIYEAELRHRDDQQEERAGAGANQQPLVAARPGEMMRMALADRLGVESHARHQCRSCRPIRRWRTMPVRVSMMPTAITISSRIAETSE